MSEQRKQLKFWGVRGSIATPTLENLRYGGNTTCLSLDLGVDEHLILDCGTGIRLFGESLTAGRPRRPMRFQVIFTHYHLDHIEGLPFFAPIYDPGNTFTFHGSNAAGRTVKEILERFMEPPYFPVPLANIPSHVDYATIDGSPLQFGDLTVSVLRLNHPNGSNSYRLERGGKRIVFATDHEHGDEATDDALVRFSEGADYLIYDATYPPSEYETLRRGWGHSTWYEGVRVARAAGVRSLVLFHHHPGHTDEQLEAVLKVAREELDGIEIAREGMTLPL
jgi:phosphoribosyl 1,2-cyclic phosphodiesterase